MLKDHPFVSIIIVNYNGKKLMKECLDSLSGLDYPKPKLEIIMVDNCSEDGSVEFVKDGWHQVKIIENKVNNYCQACNFGIIKAAGEYVVFLNNDVKVSEKWLIELVRAMEKDTAIGAATSKLLKDDGTIQNAGLYELPNFYWDERGAGKSGEEFNQADEVDAISGASVIFRRSALKQVGFLDEDFIMFGEDVDICLRLKKRGWRLAYIPLSVVYHKLHGSCNEDFAREAIERNRLLLVAKHFPDKLPYALSGSGYFTVYGKSKDSGQLFNLMTPVFLKLVKEHGPEASASITKEVFAELKRILNFENKKLESDLKGIFEDLVETKKDRECVKTDKENLIKQLDDARQEFSNNISKLNKELTDHKEELANLGNKLRDSLDAGLAKDNSIMQLNQELINHKEELTNLGNRFRDSLDAGLAKDNSISQLKAELENYKEELAILANKLKEALEARLKLENELNNIYTSRGFRFVLNPLWKAAWFLGLSFKYLVKMGLDFAWGVLSIVLSFFALPAALLFICERIFEKLLGRLLTAFRKERTVVPFDELTISVVIPNYNGLDLLKKCLSSIYALDSFKNGAYEVLVVDDASEDDIYQRIKDEFPKVRVIRNNKNSGFGRSCNRGVKEASGELIVLLNNDIMVQEGFLEPLKEHFKDSNVFAVAPKLYYWDKQTFNYGMQMGRFKGGYLSLWNEAETKNGDKVSQTSPTVFAVGGAMVFRKNDFLWLGGFDDIYRPNSWEDIDISYRAQKRGLKILYEPKSLVYHKGAATVNYVRHKEIKNELLFMWKNITDDRMLLSHLWHMPRFLYRGKHSSRISFAKGYLWALANLLPALENRFREKAYLKASDKKILNTCLLYYRNFMRNNYSHARKKTILLVTPFMLYPYDCGGKLRMYNFYKRLAKKYNLILLALIHNPDEAKYADSLKDVFCQVYTVHTKTPNRELLFPKRYKFSYSSHLIEKLEELQDKMPIDVVHIESNELLYLTEYIKYIPVAYTEHDISILSYSNSYYQKEPCGSLSGFADYLKLICYHQEAYRGVDRVVVLSREDKKVVRAFSPGTACALIPTGVDLEHFNFSKKTGEKRSLIFVGHYPHYPNEEAVVYFCKRIFPFIKKKMPEVVLKLVGSSPTREVLKLSEIDGVEVVGTVADVNPYLQEASCFVTPFRRSAGIRGKVLEALATGTPVVSTTKGACGIRAIHGREILIADNPREFAKCVIDLLMNDELYKKIAAAARKLAEEEYDWNKIAGQLDSFYQDMMQDGGKVIIETGADAVKGETCKPGGTKLPQERLSPEGVSCVDTETELLDHKDTQVALLTEDHSDLNKNGSLIKDIVGRVGKIIEGSLNEMGSGIKRDAGIGPEELHIELTHSCNSKCITCDIWDYHQKNNKSVDDELSLDEIASLIKNTKSLKDIKTVILSGGEPFLRNDLVAISGLVNKVMPQASLGILTNCLDSERVISKSKEIAGIFKAGSFWIGSSLDGLGPAYDQARGVKGGFERFANTLKRFREELPGVKFSVTFVLTPFNFEQLLPCWDFADKHGLDFFAQFGVPKQGRSHEVFTWQENQLNKIESYALRIIEKLVNKYSNLKDFRDSLSVAHDKINIMTKIYYWAHLVSFQRSKTRFSHRCDAGFKFAMFDPYGNLFFCPLLKEKIIGNIRDTGFDELWSSREAGEARNFIDTGKCSCWLVCTVFPIVDKALALYGDKIAGDLEEVKPACAPQPFYFGGSLDKKSGVELNNEEFRSGKVILDSLPQGLTLGTNYKCNADCMFCLGGEYREFSLDLYKKYFEPNLGIMLKNASHVSFCGMGELLLTRDIEDFLEHINMTLAGQNKILTTNGLAVDEKVIQRIIKSKYSLQVSLHASSAPLHAHLTGMKGAFDKILGQIQDLVLKRKDSQSPYIVLIFLANTLNIEDLPNFVGLAASLGVDCVQCNYLTVFNPAHLKLSCFFKQKITNEMFDLARENADKFKIPLVLPPKFSDDKESYFKSACSEPWRNIYVDTEGAVLPCCYSGEHFGELKDADILSIWNNKKYQELRNGLVSKNNNQMCKYCLNNNPCNVNLLDSHVSFRPDVRKKIFEDQAIK